MTTIKLKPRPFCGGKARLIASNGVRVICSKCSASSEVLVDNLVLETNAVEQVIEAWNRRTEVKE